MYDYFQDKWELITMNRLPRLKFHKHGFITLGRLGLVKATSAIFRNPYAAKTMKTMTNNNLVSIEALLGPFQLIVINDGPKKRCPSLRRNILFGPYICYDVA